MYIQLPLALQYCYGNQRRYVHIQSPLNYVLAGGSYGEDGKEKTIAGLNSATTTVEDAWQLAVFLPESIWRSLP